MIKNINNSHYDKLLPNVALKLILVLILCYFSISLLLNFLLFKVSASYGYMGFRYEALAPASFFLLLAVSIFCALLSPLNPRSVGDFFIIHSFILLIIPASVLMVSNSAVETALKAYVFMIFLLGTVFMRIFVAKILRSKFNWQRRKEMEEILTANSSYLARKRFSIVVNLLQLGSILILLSINTGLSLSYNSIYVRRLAFRDYLGGNVILSYTLAALPGIAILGLLIGLTYKNFTAICLSLITTLLLFSTYGARTDILATFLALFFYFVFRTSTPTRRLLRLIFGHLSLISLIALLTLALSNTAQLSIIDITRRAFFTPTHLSNFYFLHVVNNGFTEYAQNRIGMLLGKERLPISFAIGYSSSGDSSTNANVNFLMDGYVSLGWLGVLLACLITALLIGLMDGLNQGLFRNVLTPVFVILTLNLFNQSIFTSLLSSGFVQIIILIIFVRSLETKVGNPKLT